LTRFLSFERVAREIERLTHHARVLANVFSQLLFPREGFLIWHHIPDEDAAAAAQQVCGLRIYRDTSEYSVGSADKVRASWSRSSTDSGGCAEPPPGGKKRTKRLKLIEFDDWDHGWSLARIFCSRALEACEQISPGLRDFRFVADDAFLELDEALGVVLRVV
jgi:hypothetical protein